MSCHHHTTTIQRCTGYRLWRLELTKAFAAVSHHVAESGQYGSGFLPVVERAYKLPGIASIGAALHMYAPAVVFVARTGNQRTVGQFYGFVLYGPQERVLDAPWRTPCVSTVGRSYILTPPLLGLGPTL